MNIAELMLRNGVGSREDFMKLGGRLPRRRRRPRPATPSTRAYAEVHFHWTHLYSGFRAWKALAPEDNAAPGSVTPAHILTMFMIVKVVTLDEAIQAYHATLRDDERGQEFVRATKPLLKRARTFIPALSALRSRWVAHGSSQRGQVREPAPSAREQPGAPRDETELAFVVALYLQYFAISIVAMPGMVLRSTQYQRASFHAPKDAGAPNDEECRERLSTLSADACKALGLQEDLPLIAYDDDAL